MLTTQNLRGIAAMLLCTLLLQNCHSRLNALEEGATISQELPPQPVANQLVTSGTLTTLPGPLPSASSPHEQLPCFATPTAPRKQQKALSVASIDGKDLLEALEKCKYKETLKK